jgi:toxin ParE1/3/4
VARLSVSRDAKKDLRDIFAYIAVDNVSAARRTIAVHNDKFLALAAQPGIGRRRDEIKPGYQSHPVHRYVIYYRFAKGIVRILRFIHGARDFGKLFQ